MYKCTLGCMYYGDLVITTCLTIKFAVPSLLGHTYDTLVMDADEKPSHMSLKTK